MPVQNPAFTQQKVETSSTNVEQSAETFVVNTGAAVAPVMKVSGVSGTPLPSQTPAGWGPPVDASKTPAAWGPQPKKNMTAELLADPMRGLTHAPNAALDEDGYQSLVRKGTPEMAGFIRRVGASRDYAVNNEGSLIGFAKYYSGEAGTSSFQHLLQELDGVAKMSNGWLRAGLGATAALDEAGYKSVLSTGSPQQMTAFVRRIVAAKGFVVANEGSLSGFAQFYSGQKSSSLARMIQEIDQISKLSDGWLKRGAPPLTGLSATLDKLGCAALQAAKPGGEEMSVYVRRVVESRGYHIVDEGGLHGFAQFYSSPKAGGFTRMVEELDTMARAPLSGGWLRTGALSTTGLSASLDEAGYNKLQSEKNSNEMSIFIRRAAESRLYGIADEGGLTGFTKFYRGEAGAWPYSHLLTELDRTRQVSKSWLKSLGI
jgi:hypothetical protein